LIHFYKRVSDKRKETRSSVKVEVSIEILLG